MRFGCIVGAACDQSHHIRLGGGGCGRSTSSPFIAATRRANREKRMPERTPFSSLEITVWSTPDARSRSRCDQRKVIRRRRTAAPNISQPSWTSGNRRSRASTVHAIDRG